MCNCFPKNGVVSTLGTALLPVLFVGSTGCPVKKIFLKIPNRIPSNANHGPGLCTPTFAQHKSPTCRHNMPYMENMESRESSSDPATVVLNIFFELKK